MGGGRGIRGCRGGGSGQTSSGKTFTMMGVRGTELVGLIPRIAHLLFHTVARTSGEAEGVAPHSFSVDGSYLEIYNEKLRDLLTSTGEQLQVRGLVCWPCPLALIEQLQAREGRQRGRAQRELRGPLRDFSPPGHASGCMSLEQRHRFLAPDRPGAL